MVIAMTYLASGDMTSDTLTKSLSPAPFIHLRKKIMGNLALRLYLSSKLEFEKSQVFSNSF
jgi:hypothetical protein